MSRLKSLLHCLETAALLMLAEVRQDHAPFGSWASSGLQNRYLECDQLLRCSREHAHTVTTHCGRVGVHQCVCGRKNALRGMLAGVQHYAPHVSTRVHRRA